MFFASTLAALLSRRWCRREISGANGSTFSSIWRTLRLTMKPINRLWNASCMLIVCEAGAAHPKAMESRWRIYRITRIGVGHKHRHQFNITDLYAGWVSKLKYNFTMEPCKRFPPVDIFVVGFHYINHAPVSLSSCAWHLTLVVSLNSVTTSLISHWQGGYYYHIKVALMYGRIWTTRGKKCRNRRDALVYK